MQRISVACSFFSFSTVSLLFVFFCSETPWPAFTSPVHPDSLKKEDETEEQESSDCRALKVPLALFLFKALKVLSKLGLNSPIYDNAQNFIFHSTWKRQRDSSLTSDSV